MSINLELQKLKRLATGGINFDAIDITALFDKITYEELLTQKILLKINNSENLTSLQKEQVDKLILDAYPEKGVDVQLHIRFLSIFLPIMDSIKNEIKEKLKNSFSNSLQIFLYYLGEYVYQNPDTILLAKNLIISIANETLKNDLKLSELNTKIAFSSSYDAANMNTIDYIYNRAIEYGCIYEQYDKISYLRSRVVETNVLDKPYARIVITEKDFEKAIQIGSSYGNYLLNKKLDIEPGIIHNYYRRKVCKYCRLTGQDEGIKELLFSLLNRQFSFINTVDLFFLFTSSMPSYMLSIISFLYVEFLILILCSEDNFKIISKEYLKKNMMFSEHISENDFNKCISLLFGHKHNGLYSANCFWFMSDESIIIGRWMFNADFSIIELSNDLSYRLGNVSQLFGKEVFEKLVRKRLGDFNWNVINHNVTMKKVGTDIDLLAFKEGTVLLGQIKIAHSGRTPYQIWKARNDIKYAKTQISKVQTAFAQDPDLLFSILKHSKIVSSKKDILKVVPIIITSNFYFIESEDIPSLGFDLFDEFLCAAANMDDTSLFINAIQEPCKSLQADREPELTLSEISTKWYTLFYEEYE